jgi:glucosamine-6-phosphate isomerase
MEIRKYQNYEHLSIAGAILMAENLSKKPASLISLASGHSQTGLYHELVKLHQTGKTDFSQTVFVGLDEWEGFGKDHPGSGYYFLNEKLFRHIKVREEQVVFFDGTCPDLDSECNRINDFIIQTGPIDLVVLGVGMNGHIGLNEPGTDFHVLSHISVLDEVTQNVGQKYFNQPTEIKRGVTLGIQQIMEAKQVIVTLNGTHKATIASKMLQGPVTPLVPASVLQQHKNVIVLIDEEAAVQLRI